MGTERDRPGQSRQGVPVLGEPENADKYQPDLLLVDDRTYPQNLRQAERQPTWRSIRAAAAGAVAPWPGYWVHTYDDFAEQLEALTAVIDQADPNIGS
jgi:iron complex transport system substrate-binding protein